MTLLISEAVRMLLTECKAAVKELEHDGLEMCSKQFSEAEMTFDLPGYEAKATIYLRKKE